VPQFDFQTIAIGGVALVYLIPRLVEFIKVVTGVAGKARVWALAGGLGFVLAALAAAIDQQLIPAVALPWVNVAMVGLGGLVAACAAIGDYELNHKATWLTVDNE
jgi:hypothetical protein